MSSSGLFIVSLCNSAAGCHGESALRLSFRHEFGKKPCERAGKLCEFVKNIISMRFFDSNFLLFKNKLFFNFFIVMRLSSSQFVLTHFLVGLCTIS